MKMRELKNPLLRELITAHADKILTRGPSNMVRQDFDDFKVCCMVYNTYCSDKKVQSIVLQIIFINSFIQDFIYVG